MKTPSKITTKSRCVVPRAVRSCRETPGGLFSAAVPLGGRGGEVPFLSVQSGQTLATPRWFCPEVTAWEIHNFNLSGSQQIVNLCAYHGLICKYRGNFLRGFKNPLFFLTIPPLPVALDFLTRHHFRRLHGIAPGAAVPLTPPQLGDTENFFCKRFCKREHSGLPYPTASSGTRTAGGGGQAPVPQPRRLCSCRSVS